jgi:hypothetical protein
MAVEERLIKLEMRQEALIASMPPERLERFRKRTESAFARW